MEDRKEFLIYCKMYIEEVHIGLSTKTSKVVGTIEFEEDDLIYEGLGHKYFNGKLVIGNSVENIEGKAFYGCKSLTRVDLPSTIKHYSMSLFEKCPNLTELTMPEWMERHRKDIMDYAYGKRSTGGWY